MEINKFKMSLNDFEVIKRLGKLEGRCNDLIQVRALTVQCTMCADF
jgi:hypothetical protein